MKALILLSSLGVIALLAEIFSFKKLLYPIVLLGLITTFILNMFDWDTNRLCYKNFLKLKISANNAITPNEESNINAFI